MVMIVLLGNFAFFIVFRIEKISAEHGRHSQRFNKRDRHGNTDGKAKGHKEAANDPLCIGDRQEDRHHRRCGR